MAKSGIQQYLDSELRLNSMVCVSDLIRGERVEKYRDRFIYLMMRTCNTHILLSKPRL